MRQARISNHGLPGKMQHAALKGRTGKQSVLHSSIASASVVGMQVRASVASAAAPLTEKETEVLAEVCDMLAPARDATWPSGRPENN